MNATHLIILEIFEFEATHSEVIYLVRRHQDITV